MLISYVNLEPLTIVYLLNLDGRKISKEPIGNANDHGDEFHYILQCKYFEPNR